jgi:hypothetical protein
MNGKNQKLVKTRKSKEEGQKEKKIEKLFSTDWFIIILFIYYITIKGNMFYFKFLNGEFFKRDFFKLFI